MFPSRAEEVAAGTDEDGDFFVEPTVQAEPYGVVEADGDLLPQVQGISCRQFGLASINIPETKTTFEIRCLANNPFTGKCIAKTKVPIIYRRTSKLTLLAQVCVPDDIEIKNKLVDCIKQAIAVGIVTDVLTSGNLAAAAAVLKAYLVACLKAKFGEAVDDITVTLRREKALGVWKKL